MLVPRGLTASAEATASPPKRQAKAEAPGSIRN
jgi:hypothetical protein